MFIFIFAKVKTWLKIYFSIMQTPSEVKKDQEYNEIHNRKNWYAVATKNEKQSWVGKISTVSFIFYVLIKLKLYLSM